MKLSGILPLRNGVSLGYPFDLAIRSLQRLCDEVVVSVDPTGDDGTLERVTAMDVRVIESRWDMTNHRAHDGVSSEIAKQTAIAVAAAGRCDGRHAHRGRSPPAERARRVARTARVAANRRVARRARAVVNREARQPNGRGVSLARHASPQIVA